MAPHDSFVLTGPHSVEDLTPFIKTHSDKRHPIDLEAILANTENVVDWGLEPP